MINLFFGPCIGRSIVPGIGPCVALNGGGSIRDWGIEIAEMAAGFGGG